MAGILTTIVGAPSFRFLNGDHFSSSISMISTSNAHIHGRITRKASFNVFIDESKMKSRNLYDVLRVKRNATRDEIKHAYRSLAKRYHPDTNSNGDREFIDIHNAYVTLSDPTTRALYDLKISSEFEPRSGGIYNCSEVYTGQRWETDQCW